MSDHRVHRTLIGLLICSILVMTIVGCKSKKSSGIISSELIKQEQKFGTDTAKYGEFFKTSVLTGERAFPIKTAIMATCDGVELEAIHVQAKDVVKKGDLLVSIKPITNELLAEKEAAITKNKEEFNKGVNNYEVKIEYANSVIASSTGYELQRAETELKKLKRQLTWYIEDGDQVQQEMKKNLTSLRALQGDINIYAPYDGVVEYVESIPGGTELTTSREILTMYSEEQVLLYVKDGSKLLYMMQVDIQAGVGKNQKKYTGTVLSADNVRTDALKDGSAYIRINEPLDVTDLKNITITAKEKSLGNVLVIKEFAVFKEKEKEYITIIDGKKAMKRHVISGGIGTEMAWILQGVSEGQNVSIQ